MFSIIIIINIHLFNCVFVLNFYSKILMWRNCLFVKYCIQRVVACSSLLPPCYYTCPPPSLQRLRGDIGILCQKSIICQYIDIWHMNCPSYRFVLTRFREFVDISQDVCDISYICGFHLSCSARSCRKVTPIQMQQIISPSFLSIDFYDYFACYLQFYWGLLTIFSDRCHWGVALHSTHVFILSHVLRHPFFSRILQQQQRQQLLLLLQR